MPLSAITGRPGNEANNVRIPSRCSASVVERHAGCIRGHVRGSQQVAKHRGRVPDPSLSSIAQEESSSDGRLRRVIRCWLEKCAGTPSATWAKVAHTLRNVTVGRDDLARRKISSTHFSYHRVGSALALACI